ncbi:MAG TPA: M15 family metallopeptidase [Verrucomicrobiae bacterium]|nr:M15 family metallopeptidase [Verrucomicrobiae bacterium]
MTQSSEIADVLAVPVPSQDEAFMRKQGYREYALSGNDPHQQEPLVAIAEYGIAGQSYYSRPNSATGEPVTDVNPAVLVRRTIAERLAKINDAVQHSGLLVELFEGEVELYVDEGVRSQRVQRHLYNDVFPRLIREQFPEMADEQVFERRDQMIARPIASSSSPSPHATGAAVDLKLRYTQSNKLFVPNTEVFMGHLDADMSDTTRPDAFEHSGLHGDKIELARRNRRIFYGVMRGALNASSSGFVVNPTEWWHWSYGDQLWAALTKAPAAFYGVAKE